MRLLLEEHCVPEEWLPVKMSRWGSPRWLKIVVAQLTLEVIVRALVCRT
jgi:hypothetical protein